MLTEIYIEAFDEELADQVWEAWDKAEIDDLTACIWTKLTWVRACPDYINRQAMRPMLYYTHLVNGDKAKPAEKREREATGHRLFREAMDDSPKDPKTAGLPKSYRLNRSQKAP